MLAAYTEFAPMSALMTHRKIALAGVVALFLSCEENLPPYEDPGDVFSASVDALYILSVDENVLNVVLTVRNTFDEPLDGTLSLQGSITITTVRDNVLRKTFEIIPSMITVVPSYNPQTRRLVLNPNQSMRIEARWNFVDDQGMDLVEEFLVFRGDPTCGSRCYALGEDLRLNANVNLFSRTIAAGAPAATYRLYYVTSPSGPGCMPPIPVDQRTAELPQCNLPSDSLQ